MPSWRSFEFLRELLLEERLPRVKPNWEELPGLAASHGVQCLLLARLGELGVEPPDELRELCALSVRRNLELLSAWREARLGAPIKGLWLISKGLYQAWERPLSDADLLVDELEEASGRLSSLGFSLKAKTKTGAVFARGELLFDLHTTPFPPQLRVPRLRGLTVEHQALIAAVHLYKSLLTWGPRLIWLVDLRRLEAAVDPGALWSLAGSLGLRGALSGAFRALSLPRRGGYWGKALAAARAGWGFWLRAVFFKI